MNEKIVYIADDDKNICKLLKTQLLNDGYNVFDFYDGEGLLEKFKETPCHLIITDIMMPKMGGYDICREIRKTSEVPIIMISAKGEEIDRVLGLELGSDDYISKPFSLREVSIKVRNMLRRTYVDSVDKKEENKIVCKDLEIIPARRLILIGGKEFITTAKEYDLLELFISNKNQAFSREMIIERVWGYDYYGDTRQVDHVIKRLRKKMMLFESECKIETLWGFGYKVSD